MMSTVKKTVFCALLRRGSRINTDRFPKQAPKVPGGSGVALPGNCLDFNSLKSPFLSFRVIQTGYWPLPFSSDEVFVQSIFQISTWKFFMKNVTDFHKTVESGSLFTEKSAIFD